MGKELVPGESQPLHPLYQPMYDLYHSHPAIDEKTRKQRRPARFTDTTGASYTLAPDTWVGAGQRATPLMRFAVRYPEERDMSLHPCELSYVELYDLTQGSDDNTIPPFRVFAGLHAPQKSGGPIGPGTNSAFNVTNPAEFLTPFNMSAGEYAQQLAGQIERCLDDTALSASNSD